MSSRSTPSRSSSTRTAPATPRSAPTSWPNSWPKRAPELPVTLRPTERAGHGREIARDAARGGRPLVVSVSGDGGYNDVVNGLMEAGADTAYAAVLAAGNANDHRRVTRERPLADAIVDGDVSRLDLLKMSTDDGREARYAHSYIGLGITPTVALELEKGGKGSIKEVISTIRTFSKFRPFQIETDSGSRELRQRHLRQHPRDGEVRGAQRRGPAGRRQLRGDRPAAHGEVAGAHHSGAGGALRAGPAADGPRVPVQDGGPDAGAGRRRGVGVRARACR